MWVYNLSNCNLYRTHPNFYIMLSEKKISLAPASEQFRDEQKNAVGSSVMLDIATAAIIEQPTFSHLKDEKAPDLIPNQEQAKKLALSWRNELRKKIFDVNQSIIDYTRYFNVYYNQMMDFIKVMENDEKNFDEARSNLILMLKSLINELVKRKKIIEDTSTAIKNLYNDMLETESKLSGNLAEIKAYYEGESGRLKDLEAQITAYSEAMSNDLAYIGAGAGGVVVGALTITVGVGTLVLGGSGVPIIATGVAITAAGAASLIYGAVDYSKKSKMKSEAIAEIASISAELQIAASLLTDVSTLNKCIDTCTQNLDTIAKGWNVLINDYSSVIDALEATEFSTDAKSPVFLIEANLRVSKEAWDTLDGDAKKFKENILNPTPVDTSELDNYMEKGELKKPLKKTCPLKVVYTKGNSLSTNSESLKEKPQVSLSVAIEELVDSVELFNDKIMDIDRDVDVPEYVEKASIALIPNAQNSLKETTNFISKNENLASLSYNIKKCLEVKEEEFMVLVSNVIVETDNALVETICAGNSAEKSIISLEDSVNDTDQQLEVWINELQREKLVNETMLRDTYNLYNKVKAEKKLYEKLLWIPFVNIAAAIKLDKLNDDINKYRSRLSYNERSLDNVYRTIGKTSSLSIMTGSLKTDVDAVLKSLQYISVMLNDISTGMDENEIFLIKSKLSVIADQLQELGTLRLRKSAKKLYRSLNNEETKNEFSDFLESCVASGTLVNIAANTCVSQPDLMNVENLLKQDAVVLRKNAGCWFSNYSSVVIDILSSYRNLCRSIINYSQPAKDYIKKGEFEKAETFFDALIDNFIYLAELNNQFLHSLSVYIQSLKQNDAEFGFVQDLVRKEITPELNQMILTDTALSNDINKALEDIVNESSKMIGEFLTAELLICLSVALGQVELGVAGSSTLVTYLKKGINIGIEKGSEKLCDAGMEKFAAIKGIDNVIDELVEKRCENLKDISRTKSDISVINILRSELSNMNVNIDNITNQLKSNRECVLTEARDFIYIKSLLNKNNVSVASEMIDKKIENWMKIEKLVGLLLQNYVII